MITLQDATGKRSEGEIAPLPRFGSETFQQALAFCSQYSQGITETEIAQIPDKFPACQFGFETALAGFSLETSSQQTLSLSVLLPAGETVLKSWQSSYQQGERTFKWKIGVFSLNAELAWFQQWVADLPDDV
ncbi:MAG: o-succinylbenzoate synthase, partial [Halothece sp. Uz-M2-17]|nr:o-succinylbenzoate synthase [Halothece sp. Uz-M2-17]